MFVLDWSASTAELNNKLIALCIKSYLIWSPSNQTRQRGWKDGNRETEETYYKEKRFQHSEMKSDNVYSVERCLTIGGVLEGSLQNYHLTHG
jgi:hypothetical protein